ncbi:tRNA (uridine(54)-C5)-methyltransferase TrmA [Psychrobium sp. 1_MG-2023]|uniref:tRNA (uridine(54)-C5)-methyltransferase TrmA n=1 Tax=Psychrobium sp. 1_MG-2023 TaxID=3062624 RepID=UPI000C338935|nr:tRNA (uridine(54)-C5)-methyltransferase TrmA [Psychrobium sp. 1_MG-2023]MDP2562271.1 tRNA (uridine(54)-C5)-methyltransferase TrmA [Psychrobium sp. 1_MG-2023]PKF54655.1 tRNA (uridine(54)-C5)-methyltransferase TrmA [Alteromonadales bacterium alter-6D02]
MLPGLVDVANYQKQLTEKEDFLKDHFKQFNPPALESYCSQPENYRLRAEFRVWHQGDDLYHIVFNSATKEKVRVDQFPSASVLINQMMTALMAELKDNPALRFKLFQIDYLSTLSGEIIVSMLYHRQLDEAWQAEAVALKERLSKEFNVQIIGRARKQKICLDHDFVIEKLQVNNKELIYKQVENSFTQPNGGINQKMLEWATDITKDATGDLLELYCGNGNFSLALAENFNRVLATEIAKPSVDSAQYNISENKIDNVTILRMAAEEFTQAMHGEREFRRLKGIDLKSFNCNTILVDPPRAGLDQATLAMIQAYDNIIYISCNPETLADNLLTLCETHNITRFALFDQFPYTHHMESGVYLTKK